MADLEQVTTSRSARSGRSLGTLQPGLSRQRTSASRNTPVFPPQYLDDHSTYQGVDDVEDDISEIDLSPEAPSESFGEKESQERSPACHDNVYENDIETVSSRGHADFVPVRSASRPQKTRTRSIQDPRLVTWDGAEDPTNPKNWSLKKKWAATVVVSCFTLMSPVSSSMVAPALPTIAQEFGIQNEVESQLVLSIFLLAYAIGPLLLGPLSEIYGRVIVLQLANLFYLVFNIACGVSQSKSQLTAFRFFAGLGGSAPLAIGGGVLSDCWRAEERGKSVAIYSLAPLLGPAIGPIAGGFITKHTTWRWAFHATSIADAVVQIGGIFLLQETYPPKILSAKVARLRKITGDDSLYSEYDHPEKTRFKIVQNALVRPFILLSTQPIIQVIAIYMAFLYGLMYLVLSTFAALWSNPDFYNQPIDIGGLNYISLGLGFFVGSQACARLNDKIYRALKERGSGIGKPEFRTPLLVVGAILIPSGLFIYGWAAQYRTHWIVPNVGTCILSAGMIVGFQCQQTYIVDAYTRYAASGIASATLLRSLAGFGFPLFAPYMYAKLDMGWGNSLLGFIAIVLGGPAPFLLWRYGEKLRKKSPYAAGG
ncbi:hypothetical protein AJ79_00217 [Helicocarpus griseus UAMH5409]|uniref:Major facilitator superfamily (MFS) profile domain-containing protein n=1 Tax=Helicocarpus griseus UAMH5409 TaxID=1447875 RepID=A0A2B7Y3W7_9EURO|nr:hypothetical protein AJ79_00217 [Helicocarpus griseus UAMH5409]